VDNQESQAVTRILTEVSSGNKEAAAELWDLVYSELRDLASRKMARIPAGQTLQPTALVHEAYIRLLGSSETQWENRAHFFGAAACAMRNILVDRARKRGRIKHGGGFRRIPIQEVDPAAEMETIDLLALDEALTRLDKHDSRLCEMTMLRFFAGLTIEDTSKALGVSTATVERDWSYARAWLFREMNKGGRQTGPGGPS